MTKPTYMQPISKPINVLLLEDRETDAEMVIRELRRAGFTPTWKRVETESDFLAEIKTLPDIILSDYSMPQYNGLQAVELLQKSGLNIPFILISGTVGEDAAIEAMQHGATDYLLKDRIARLGVAVERALEQKRLRDEREQAAVAIQNQMDELQRWHNATLGREDRILELKQEVNELLTRQNLSPRYSDSETP